AEHLPVQLAAHPDPYRQGHRHPALARCAALGRREGRRLRTMTTTLTAGAALAPATEELPAARRTWPVLRTALTTLAKAVTAFVIAIYATFVLGAASRSHPAAVALVEVASQADVDRLNRVFGPVRPLLARYVDWISHASLGDLGTSWFTT